MIDVPEIPETLHSQRERGRLHAQGRRTDDNSGCTLLVIHGLGAPGVRLAKAEMIALAEAILVRALWCCRVAVTLDVTMTTATVLTCAQTVEVGQAILKAAR